MWVRYPDDKPAKSGYHMTQYYNPEKQHWLFKALWFDVDTSTWRGPWGWSYNRVSVTTIEGKEAFMCIHTGIKVKQFDDESRADYYGMCGSQCPPLKETNEENIQS
jgi:hypothetical protein